MKLDEFSKEELKALIQIYARNIYAMDGVWFQSIEQEKDMDEAMHHDRNAMKRFTRTEAQRIKNFLRLPEQAGLEGLEQALSIRFSALANPKVELIRNGNSLLYRVVDCRVQTARARKGMPFHPCKSVGYVEHADFAKVIDDRIECETVSCFPDVTDDTCACAWKFTLLE
ncbi:MAG: DUF6125 family protein [Tannerella sp.]|jgi:hypothetical protein|nr:DUF6125 family protein [Tannerella sp.]